MPSREIINIQVSLLLGVFTPVSRYLMKNQPHYRLGKLATRYNIFDIQTCRLRYLSLLVGRGSILADASGWARVRHVGGKHIPVIFVWRDFSLYSSAILLLQLGLPWKGPITTSKGRMRIGFSICKYDYWPLLTCFAIRLGYTLMK